MPATGTTPRGAANERQASHWVRDMFARVAPRYDLVNHLLSLNIDRHWRAHTVRRTRDILRRTGAIIVDVCCGTGDLTRALSAERGAPVIGTDFCLPMLSEARQKLARANLKSPVFEADALELPLRDASVDLVTCAFGFRNLVSYERGLCEFRRVLRPGGMVAILEFSHPPNRAFRAAYDAYSRYVLPRIGGLLTGAPDAYTYLPESVQKFPSAEELAERMRNSGFEQVTFERLTFGVVALHIGTAAG